VNYLVTGGAGFIGSHVARRLLDEGHEVLVLDDLSSGSLEKFPKGARLETVDICDADAIHPFFRGMDGVFHLAALPRVPLSVEDPIRTHRVNVDGFLNVLVAARDAKVRRVVFSSSSAIYGGGARLPQQEGMPADPLNPYALQKHIGEGYAKLFAQLYGLQTVSLRYFNVYGPGMADEGAYSTVVAHFLLRRRAGLPLRIDGDGAQTRDFVHVDDVAEANVRAMDSEAVGMGEVINVGSGRRFSVNEIAAMVGGPVQRGPARAGDARDTLADIRRAEDLLGWEPRVSLEDGIRRLLREYRISA
jgi:UDP-glucose 4-epimerase